MIETGRFKPCECVRRHEPNKLCDGALTLQEKGKKVTLSLKQGEQGKALVIDGCICADKSKKCDGVFLYKRGPKKWIALVELKGSHLDDAFGQLDQMRNRDEYNELIDLFRNGENYPIKRAFFVISNHIFSKPEIQKLENAFQFRLTKVLHSEATRRIPDLRDYLR
ncbi:hypothetical protein [Mangrovibacterium marinum]|uniref:Uncharacterized protein n=1 Tax=Mangrovibacterium marinum TaxID=1639118 RepID=A0A2T5BYG4_9BACT|nr:hypothetical protein [Mangrovibacterium marinum]PTN07258.1 hypothetical protein C8N47_12043 [Mangrovibacterium marinum]